MDFKLHVDHIAFFFNGALRTTSGQKISGNEAKPKDITEEPGDDEKNSSEKKGEFAAAKQFPRSDLAGKQTHDNRGQRRAAS